MQQRRFDGAWKPGIWSVTARGGRIGAGTSTTSAGLIRTGTKSDLQTLQGVDLRAAELKQNQIYALFFLPGGRNQRGEGRWQS